MTAASNSRLGGFMQWLASLAQVPETMRASAKSLTTEEAQALRAISTLQTPKYIFPARLEAHFQERIRLANRLPRLFLAFSTCLTFLTAPLWIPGLLKVPAEALHLMNLMELGFLAPLFALVCFLLIRYPAAVFTELLLLIAFTLEIACAEALRFFAETSGVATESLMSIAVPVAVLTLARLPVMRCVLFVALYFLIIIAAAHLQPTELANRQPTAWLLETLVLFMCFVSAVWSRLSFRRQWASNVLAEVMAYRDPLTGLANRRAFDDHYHLVRGEALRNQKHELIIALLDLDHFKKLNDVYGHDYGDQALVKVGRALAQFARRPLDLAARLGGEEFALLLYDCNVSDARVRLQELVKSIHDLNIAHLGGDQGVLTGSVGAAQIRLDEPLASSYRDADEMLYQVKQSGRNNYGLAE